MTSQFYADFNFLDEDSRNVESLKAINQVIFPTRKPHEKFFDNIGSGTIPNWRF